MKIKIPRWVSYYATLLTEESIPEKFIVVFIFCFLLCKCDLKFHWSLITVFTIK